MAKILCYKDTNVRVNKSGVRIDPGQNSKQTRDKIILLVNMMQIHFISNLQSTSS